MKTRIYATPAVKGLITVTKEKRNYANMSNFHPVEVVDRGSETQLQLGENNKITYEVKD